MYRKRLTNYIIVWCRFFDKTKVGELWIKLVFIKSRSLLKHVKSPSKTAANLKTVKLSVKHFVS